MMAECDHPFSSAARWIWLDGRRLAYHRYVEAFDVLHLTRSQYREAQLHGATLRLTAESLYMARLNGVVVGHGPSKAAPGDCFVDTYDVTGNLQPGDNHLHVLVLSLGSGNYSHVAAKAGLIFEINAADRAVSSGPQTHMREVASRRRPTVRRWFLPCVERVDAHEKEQPWRRARVVEEPGRCRPRRVPLETRQPLSPRRIVHADRVALPEFCVSLRLRPTLLPEEEHLRTNVFSDAGYILTQLHSSEDQTVEMVSTTGSGAWHDERGRRLFELSPWGSFAAWLGANNQLRLRRGANLLIGSVNVGHVDDLSLAAFARHSIEAKSPFGEGRFAVLRTPDGGPAVQGSSLCEIDFEQLAEQQSETDPAHSFADGDDFARVSNARVRPGSDQTAEARGLVQTPAGAPLRLPATPGSDEAWRVIVDLGAVHLGYLAFDAYGSAGSRLIIAGVESLNEADPTDIRWPHPIRNAMTYVLRDGHQAFESFLNLGARYLIIHHTGSEPVTLANVRMLSANGGSRPSGAFRCNDTLLNDVHRISEQTLISGTDSTYIDCPLFEQVNWNLDNRSAFLGDVWTTANMDVARHSIELFAEAPSIDGKVAMCGPGSWTNFQIPLWPMHWVLWVRDYHWYSGDLELVRRVLPRVVETLDAFAADVDERGLLCLPNQTPWQVWHHIEFGEGRDDDHAVMTAEQAGLYEALRSGADLLDRARRGGRRPASYRKLAARIKRAVNQRLWCDDRGAYADSLHDDGALSPVSSQTTNAFVATCGIAPEARCRQILDHLRRGDLLEPGSAYGMFYILNLLDQAGDVEAIFRIIRHRWGDMVRAGDATLWELFPKHSGDTHGTRSRCHPYAAYVVGYLVKYILGITPRSPGFGGVRIAPNPPDGVTSATGAIATPKGYIRIAWDERTRSKPRVTLPRGVRRV